MQISGKNSRIDEESGEAFESIPSCLNFLLLFIYLLNLGLEFRLCQLKNLLLHAQLSHLQTFVKRVSLKVHSLMSFEDLV